MSEKVILIIHHLFVEQYIHLFNIITILTHISIMTLANSHIWWLLLTHILSDSVIPMTYTTDAIVNSHTIWLLLAHIFLIILVIYNKISNPFNIFDSQHETFLVFQIKTIIIQQMKSIHKNHPLLILWAVYSFYISLKS